jgi:uncharacterized protein
LESFPDWLRISIFGITQFVMLVGLFGLVVPIFPGIVVIWLAALGYGAVTGFHTFSIVMMVLISMLMLAGVTVDNFLMGAGARKGGASWLTVGVALVAGVVGTIFLPPFGGLIAAPLSVLLLEYWRLRDLKKAGQAVLGLATGYGLSFIARFGIGMIMMILWWVWVWKG